jgi:hypothetical protein
MNPTAIGSVIREILSRDSIMSLERNVDKEATADCLELLSSAVSWSLSVGRGRLNDGGGHGYERST